MAVDRVKPLKLESPDSGGVETDDFPTSTNVNEDFLDCRGVAIQNDTSDDEAVLVSRDASGNLTFLDVANTVKTLTDLVAGTGGLTTDAHKVLRQLIHFIDEGPAEGFASGAYKETTPTGPFPTSIIWWASAAKLVKIVELAVTYTGAFPTTMVWKVYDAAGVLLATVSDAITYSGAFESSRTRTITVP